MALKKADYHMMGVLDARAGNQSRRPASGWQYDAYMVGWNETVQWKQDEAAVPKATVAAFAVPYLERHLKRRAEATVKRLAHKARMREALTIRRERRPGPPRGSELIDKRNRGDRLSRTWGY